MDSLQSHRTMTEYDRGWQPLSNRGPNNTAWPYGRLEHIIYYGVDLQQQHDNGWLLHKPCVQGPLDSLKLLAVCQQWGRCAEHPPEKSLSPPSPWERQVSSPVNPRGVGGRQPLLILT